MHFLNDAEDQRSPVADDKKRSVRVVKEGDVQDPTVFFHKFIQADVLIIVDQLIYYIDFSITCSETNFLFELAFVLEHIHVLFI